MSTRGSDEVVRIDADASLDALIHTLTHHAARTLGVVASACSAATVRGCDRWLSAASVAVARCDAVQDRNRLGPRYLVRETGAPAVVPEVGADERWPVWSHACEVQGFRSVLVVPGTYGHVTVHLSLYSPETPDWSGVTPRALGLAHGIATVVAARDEIIELGQTMDDLLASSRSQAVLDRAVGVVMARRGCAASEAIAYLKAASGARDAREVAAGLIAGAAAGGGVVAQRGDEGLLEGEGPPAGRATVGGHPVATRGGPGAGPSGGVHPDAA